MTEEPIPQELPDPSDAADSGAVDSTVLKKGESPLLAQFMVLLNGLILTITAFATLTIFINDMKNNEMKENVARVETSLRENFDLLRRDMDLLEPLVASTPSEEIVPLIQKRVFSTLSRANVIAWQDSNTQNPMRILFKQEEGPNESDAIAQLMAGFAQKTPSSPGELTSYIVSDTSLKSPLLFLISTPTYNRNAESIGSIVVALKSEHLLDWTETQKNHPSLAGLKITNAANNVLVGSYGLSPEFAETSNFSIDIGGQAWIVTTSFKPSGGHTILSYVPTLMLFFGMTLTLIGLLYVRSNQRQSIRLHKMNMLLRDKNRDVRRQMERTEQLYESLQASERDFSAVINSVNDVIFETDKSGRIVFLNHAWQRLTGYQTDECLGKHLFDYVYSQDQAEPREAFDDIFRSKRYGYTTFLRIITHNNKQRFVELVFSLTRTDDAGNERLVGMMTDIEERRQAEMALRDAEKRYRTIVENAVSGLFQVANDGRFISANPALAKLLGYDSVEELLKDSECNKNRLFADFKDKDLLLRLVKRQGQVKSFEVRYRRQNGHVFWVSENLRAITDSNGEVLYYEGAIDDITQRKEAEIAMQKARLESDLANRAKTEFLANMGHELRTPLNAMIGFSDIIQQESLGPIGNQIYLDYAREINAGSKQLLKIMNEILEVSRVELADRPISESAIDLGKTVDTCLSLVRAKAEEKLIIIESTMPPHMPIIVGSETAFKQMMLNLLHNAIAYTPQGGQIAIEALLDQDHSVRVSVADNGIGMDPEDVRNALQPLDASTEDGLEPNRTRTFGLSLVRSLIAQHNGRMEIISHKGVGTTATLVIPPSRVVGILDKNTSTTSGKLNT